jgi:uncharacterized protein
VAKKKAPARDPEESAGLTIKEGRLGRGVFATRRFRKGDVVERCPTIEVADDDVSGRLGDYVFTSVKEGDVLLVLGNGMLYNHSADPNVEYLQDDPTTIVFKAVRTVKRGEELTIDYGEEWWEERGLTPD